MVVYYLFCILPYVVSLDFSLVRKIKGNIFMLSLRIEIGRSRNQYPSDRTVRR